MEARLAFKDIKILKIYIILGVSLNSNIYLNIYSNLDWGGNKDNYYFIINYFFEIINKAIF